MLSLFKKVARHFEAGGLGKRSFLLYAIGEIFLIVVGILIASYVNDWSASKAENKDFISTLEQVYSAAHLDWERGRRLKNVSEERILLIDKILKNPDSMADDTLAMELFFCDNSLPFRSHAIQLLPFLNYHSDRFDRREMTIQITTYTNQIFWDLISDNKSFGIADFLLSRNIPAPNILSWTIDSSLWTKEDYVAIRLLLKTKELKALLKRAQSLHRLKLDATSFELSECKSLRKSIRAYSPDLKLFFADIGIIGSALPTGWNKSIPMKLTNPVKSTWEMDIQLNDGFVKFRNQDIWRHNWGGSTFPDGETIFDGHNIPVKKGFYHVELNIEEGTYKFKKLSK